MLEQSLSDVYTEFKLHFYRRVFSRLESREASLTTAEAYCIKIIHALGHSAVNELVSSTQVSPPNTACKMTNLIQKGCLKKARSKMSEREYFPEVTPKCFEYYNLNHGYALTVIDRIKDRFTPQKVTLLDHILAVMYDELMPEVPLPHKNQDLPWKRRNSYVAISVEAKSGTSRFSLSFV